MRSDEDGIRKRRILQAAQRFVKRKATRTGTGLEMTRCLQPLPHTSHPSCSLTQQWHSPCVPHHATTRFEVHPSQTVRQTCTDPCGLHVAWKCWRDGESNLAKTASHFLSRFPSLSALNAPTPCHWGAALPASLMTMDRARRQPNRMAVNALGGWRCFGVCRRVGDSSAGSG